MAALSDTFKKMGPAWLLATGSKGGSGQPSSPTPSTSGSSGPVPPPPPWLPPTAPVTPTAPSTGTSDSGGAGPVQNTQVDGLPPLAADAQKTAIGIFQMLMEYGATKNAPDVAVLASNPDVVAALAARASGLDRKFVFTLPGTSSKGEPIRVMGAFAMNEIWMSARLASGPAAIGPLANFLPQNPGPNSTPAIREALSLSWPGQLYYGLILLDSFRGAIASLDVPSGKLGLLMALWAYWRASSPANQKVLMKQQPDESACYAALVNAQGLFKGALK